MNLVYVHVGTLNIKSYVPSNTAYTYNHVPDYVWYSIKQSRKYYLGPIHLILPENDLAQCKDRASTYNCNLHSVEDIIINSNTSKDFLKVCLTTGHTNDHFLCVTFLRLFILCDFIVKNDLKKIWHIENDNLIFANFPELTEKVSYANVSDTEASAGIMYILNAYYAQLFAKDLLEHYKLSPHKSEMRVLKDLAKLYYIKYFSNTEPDSHGFVYDGASFGQYIAGTNQGHGPGFISSEHYFSDMVNRGAKLITINGLPKLQYNNKDSSVFNLHIHNKKCIEYIVNRLNEKHL